MHYTRNLFASLFLFSLLAPVETQGQDLLSPFKAREIGPTVFGGRVVDIDVDLQAPHRIFVASASGGLFKTENNGTTWTNIFENENTISIGDIALDPTDSNTIWIGTGEANNQRSSLWGDGVYKTTDGGKTWSNMGLVDSHHIGRIVVNPDDSNVVYVAALGHLYSSNEERGLFKTVDGGKTWDKVLYVNEHVGVVDVVINPADPNTLFAATYERLRRAWDFDGAGPGSAIYRSTDAGKSWQKMTKGLPSGEIGRIGIDIYAANPKIVYATVSNQNLQPVRTQRRSASANRTSQSKASTNQETESSDKLVTPFGFYIESTDKGFIVSGLPSNHPARRLGLDNKFVIQTLGGVDTGNAKAFVEFVEQLKANDRLKLTAKLGDKKITIDVAALPSRLTAPRQIGGEVYRSEDGGDSWKKVNRQPVGGSPAYYYGQIRIDPKNDQRLYMLSVPCYTSTDGGKNWSAVARSVHVDHHALWINPHSPNHIMLGNDGGFHQSYDFGQTMDHYFNIPMSQFYALTVDMQEPYHIYGGTQDNGSWGGPSRGASSRRGRGSIGPFDWYRVGGGDGFYVQVDPTDHNFLIAESQFGAIFKINRKTGLRRSIRPRPTQAGERYRFNWNSPILMSFHDPRIIYFGGNKLFKSMNQGDDWEEISQDLTTADPEKLRGNVPHCTITTIAESRRDKKLLMVGTDDGKVQLTSDGGRNWIDLSDNFPFRPAEWWCSRVELSAHDPKIAYATFTGYREDDFRCFVYKTTDLGQTWTSIAGNLPQESVNVIKEDAKNPNLLYMGTEFGCYVTLDGGKSWNSIGSIPRVSVQDLIIHPRDNDLVLGTHGRGFFVIDDITPLQQLGNPTKSAVQLLEPRTIKSYQTQSAPSYSGDRIFRGSSPAEAGKVWYRVQSKSDQKFEIKVVDSQGKTVHTSTTKPEPGLYGIRVVRGSTGQFTRRGRTPPQDKNTITVTSGTYEITLNSSPAGETQTVKLVVE